VKRKRERERERDTHRERKRDRQRERERERERERTQSKHHQPKTLINAVASLFNAAGATQAGAACIAAN
jgi:hypothetical protein